MTPYVSQVPSANACSPKKLHKAATRRDLVLPGHKVEEYLPRLKPMSPMATELIKHTSLQSFEVSPKEVPRSNKRYNKKHLKPPGDSAEHKPSRKSNTNSSLSAYGIGRNTSVINSTVSVPGLFRGQEALCSQDGGQELAVEDRDVTADATQVNHSYLLQPAIKGVAASYSTAVKDHL